MRRHQACNAMIAILLAGCVQEGAGPQWAVDAPGAVPGGVAQVVPQLPQRQEAVPPMPPPLDTSRMQTAQIIDGNGFGQPMLAAVVQIPAGWEAVGGISWHDATNCIANQMQLGWSAVAPDSLTAIEILPGFNWQVAGTEIQMNPCPSAPYRSTREFLMATVQRTRPGAQVLQYESLPELEQQMAQAAQGNPQAQTRHDAGRLLIAYPKDGVMMHEALTAAVTFSSSQGNVVAGTGTINALRAPAGRLDRELAQRIAGSIQPDPQWMQAMQQRSMASLHRYSTAQRNSINDWHNRQMAIINARGAADRAAIRMRTNQEVAGIYGAIAANSSATNDRMQARTIAGINEVNNYAGTDGNTVQASIHGGNRVFQDTSNPGNVYSTDAPYAQPPSGYVELQRQP